MKERDFIKALNEMDMNRMEKVLKGMENSIDDLLFALNQQEEVLYVKFMYDLINEVEKVQKAKYDPDYEYWLKHPETEIFKQLD